ncbi:hypothetical protein H8959_004252 [Pygathrix nigripes]
MLPKDTYSFWLLEAARLRSDSAGLSRVPSPQTSASYLWSHQVLLRIVIRSLPGTAGAGRELRVPACASGPRRARIALGFRVDSGREAALLSVCSPRAAAMALRSAAWGPGVKLPRRRSQPPAAARRCTEGGV